MNFQRGWRKKNKIVQFSLRFHICYIFQEPSSRLSDGFSIYHLAIMHITALVILISWYILLPLSETSFSFSIFHRFSVSSNRGTRRTSPTVPFSPACSFLLLPHIVFRLISLCLYLSFCLFLFLSFSLLPSSGLNILRTFEAAAKGIKVPTALRAFLL